MTPHRIWTLLFLPLLLFAGAASADQTWTTAWTPDSAPAARNNTRQEQDHSYKTNCYPCKRWVPGADSGRGAMINDPENAAPRTCPGDNTDYLCMVCDGQGDLMNKPDGTKPKLNKICCGGTPHSIWFRGYDSCCDTDGDGIAETPYNSDKKGCCPKGPDTSEQMVVELSCTDADGNKICPNCDSDGDGIYNDCLAVNPKGPDGQPLDDCAAAAQAELGPLGGAVICKDGELIACVMKSRFPSGNPSSAIVACAQCHENLHLNKHNPKCLIKCGWDTAKGLNMPGDECQAMGAMEACLQGKVAQGEIDEQDDDYLHLIKLINDNKDLCQAWAPGKWESEANYCNNY